MAIPGPVSEFPVTLPIPEPCPLLTVSGPETQKHWRLVQAIQRLMKQQRPTV